jgi:hypothetical protein
VILVTGATFNGGDAVSVETTPHIHRVLVCIVSLPRKISAGVAIHTARVMQHRDHGFKGTRGRSIISQRHSINALVLSVRVTGGASFDHPIEH